MGIRNEQNTSSKFDLCDDNSKLKKKKKRITSYQCIVNVVGKCIIVIILCL